LEEGEVMFARRRKLSLKTHGDKDNTRCKDCAFFDHMQAHKVLGYEKIVSSLKISRTAFRRSACSRGGLCTSLSGTNNIGVNNKHDV
jgi:hypothetical protein